ncbi:MAG: recombination mediator RecR [Candidatus Aminicenantia bacterium]
MFEWAEPLKRLINELKKIPGIGSKSAQRISFYLLKAPEDDVKTLSEAIKNVKEKLKYCSICNNITDVDPCRICSDERRDDGLICVVEEPFNVSAIEKTEKYKGKYHVLLGTISPLKGIGPEKLKIEELFNRIKRGNFREVIIATNPTVEGEATSQYIIQLLKTLNVKISRLAIGIPVGSDIDFADQVTIARALEGRFEIKD